MPEATLNRDQVDELLALIERGDVDLRGGPAAPFPPRQMDIGQVRGELERWLEDAARLVENWLIGQVDDHLRCHSAGLVPRVGPIDAPPAALALMGCPGQDPLLSVWDRPLVDALLAGLLGHSFSHELPPASSAPRPLTEIDLRLLRRSATGLAGALRVAWPRGEERRFEVLAVAADAGSLPQGAAAPSAMAARFTVSAGEDVLGGIEFRMPGWIARELRVETTARPAAVRGNPDMQLAVEGLAVDVVAEMSLGAFALDRILALRVGDELTVPGAARARLCSGDVTHAEGIPGVCEGRWAIAVDPTPIQGDDDGTDHA